MTSIEYQTRRAELRRQMDEIEAQYRARIITSREHSERFCPLNDEHKALTGAYYTVREIEPVRTSVHHERAYLHFR